LAVFASSALCFVFLAALYDESVTTAARSSLGIWENAHSFWQQKDSSGKKIKKTHAAAFKRNLAGDDAYQANNNGDDQANNNGDDQAANNNYNDDQAANNNNDDQAANNDDLNQNYGYGNDDGAPDADDYFYDYFTDDYASDDTTIDDFYAFEQEDRAPRLFPLTPRVLLGYMIAAMALTLGASGGIGGGGIIVPVFILIMGLQPKVAIPIGAATVLGGSIGSTLMNFSRRHPLADRPIIDWDLVLVMEPLTLVGALLGTKFHSLFSEKFLVVLLVLLLSFTAHATLTKAMRMYDAEKRYIRHLKAAQSEPPNGSPVQSLTWGFDVEAMILFTACTSCTSYVIFGLLLWDYAITGFIIGFFAAIAGQK
jgi:uncharacterized membrane protein YfcA